MCERDVCNQIILRSLGDSPSPCNPGLQFLCSWTYGGVSTMQTPQRRHTCWWPVFEETQPFSSRCLQLSWCYLAKQWLRDIAQRCLSREKTLCSLPYFHLCAEAEPFSVFLSDSSLGNPCHVMGQNSTSIGPGLTFRHVLLSRSLLGLRRLWLWESEEEDASGRCYGSRMGCTDGLVRCGVEDEGDRGRRNDAEISGLVCFSEVGPVPRWEAEQEEGPQKTARVAYMPWVPKASQLADGFLDQGNLGWRCILGGHLIQKWQSKNNKRSWDQRTAQNGTVGLECHLRKMNVVRMGKWKRADGEMRNRTRATGEELRDCAILGKRGCSF